jgi:uncharacterized LabA/DUF88 family protein
MSDLMKTEQLQPGQGSMGLPEGGGAALEATVQSAERNAGGQATRSGSELKLRGKCVVYVDWANVHGWEKSLKREVNPQKLFSYLKTYAQIGKINLYFGTDKHPKSKAFISRVRKIGFGVTTKSVKYITVFDEETKKRFRFRKCDFDMETCIDVHRDLSEGVESFVFFTGDGDFEPLYKLLIEKCKQVIVVYSPGHLGREIWNIQRGLFKIQLTHVGL